MLDEAELLRLRRTYAGTVTLVDRWLGELFDALRNLAGWTILWSSSRATRASRWASTAMSGGSGPWLYEELIHTPLIVRMPGGQHGGGAHKALVQTVDLLPTMLSALGFRPRAGVHGPGPAQLDSRRADQVPRLCVHGDGR